MQNDDSEIEQWGSIVTLVIVGLMVALAFATQIGDNNQIQEEQKHYEIQTYPKEFVAGYTGKETDQ